MKSKKSKLMNQADKLWQQILIKPVCEVCGQPSDCVHHHYYKGSFGHMRYLLDNGIVVCRSCHYKIHFKDPKPIEAIIEAKRGKKWSDMLKEISKYRKSSFKTIDYYNKVIANLRSALLDKS